MSEDHNLMDEAREIWRMFSGMARTHAELSFAIDAHLRGLDWECWGHLFESAMARDEARALLAQAAK